MQEFVDDRRELLGAIPEFEEPDFANAERLPVGARLTDDDEEEVEDEWRKFSEEPLSHMTPKE